MKHQHMFRLATCGSSGGLNCHPMQQQKHISQDLQKKDIKHLTLESLEGVTTYQFLLDSGGQAHVQELMAKVVQNSKGSRAARPRPAPKAMPGSSSSSRGQQTKASKLRDGVNAAADMFR